MGLQSLLRKILYLLLIFLPVSSSVWAQGKNVVSDVQIQGNLRVGEDAIRLHVKVREGEPFNSALVNEDVKSIYRMGFFDDVKAELSPEGVLTYVVTEKPYVKEIKIFGNSQVEKAKIETALGISARMILDEVKVQDGVENVKRLYSEQGYVNARVDYVIESLEANQAVLHVDIQEGQRLLIKKISFEGNQIFSDSDLKALMATKEKWFLSFLTKRGVLDQDILTNDLTILSTHYYDHGYIQHKIGEPVILKRKDGIEVVIRVEEGEQYRVGKVEIGGDLIRDPEELLGKVRLTTGQIFRGSRLRRDIQTLTETYADEGFAFAEVDPLTRIEHEEKKVDVALVIKQGPPVYVNRIEVVGNTKTRDKVIRREMTLAEQELFSTDKIKQSRNALQRTGYFEDVQLTTKRTDRENMVDLLVDVKEGPTGSFAVGAGLSSGDNFFLTASVSERNLFGRGQALSANFNLGTQAQDFRLSFTEPYLYDTRVSAGVDLFNTQREFRDFDSRRTGFGVRSGYPLKDVWIPFLRESASEVPNGRPRVAHRESKTYLDFMRVGMSYQLTREKISEIESDAPASIRDEEGKSLTSSLTPSLSYDSRDHFFNPTEGANSELAVKFAGLGGDNRFLKTDARGRWYYPFLKDPEWGGTYTLALGGTLGVGVGLKERLSGEKDLPLFERYFVGGMDSVRGFADRSLGPREEGAIVGGDKQVVMNAEVHFPIWESFGLRGLTFFDMGQAFSQSESINFGEMRRSVGVGANWMSPFGPLRVSFGFPLNSQSEDDTSLVGFSFGQ